MPIGGAPTENFGKGPAGAPSGKSAETFNFFDAPMQGSTLPPGYQYQQRRGNNGRFQSRKNARLQAANAAQ